jgi:hypothetical protein
MVENTQRVCKIQSARLNGQAVDAAHEHLAIRQTSKVPTRDFNYFRTRINAEKTPNTRGNHGCPPTTTAADVHTKGVRRDARPRKDPEICSEHRTSLAIRHAGLIESLPFVSETLNDLIIGIIGVHSALSSPHDNSRAPPNESTRTSESIPAFHCAAGLEGR